MKARLITLGTAMLFSFAGFTQAQPDNGYGRDPYYGNEYQAPPTYSRYDDACRSDVREMIDAGVYDGDIPVILYIRAHSPYSLRQIYSLRLNGARWDQLSAWCGVRLDIPLIRAGYGPAPVVVYHRHDRIRVPYGYEDRYREHGMKEGWKHGRGNKHRERDDD